MNQAHDHEATRGQLIAAFAAIYIFWGASFLAVRYAVADIPPLLTMGFRCAGGAVILSLWVRARDEWAPTTRAEWKTAALAGALLFIVCHGLLAWAEQRVTSGTAALFLTGIPLWAVLLTSWQHRQAPSRRILLALVLGIAGVAVLTGGGGWSGQTIDKIALIVSAFGWAAGSLVGRHGSRPRSSTQATTMQLVAGAVWLLSASVLSGELTGWSPSHVTMRSALAMVFLVTCGTAIGFGAYTWLLRVTRPAVATSYAFVNPIVALGLGWIVGDDRVTGRTLVAAVLVIGAVLLTRESE
ncbi:MAG: EamA family transporter [Gemmatimonadota bacterium]